jgi:mRNA interferase RelE/StbE
VTARRYALQFRPAALRQLHKLPIDALRRIRTATEELRDEPRPEGAGKLAGTHDPWRIRVGVYRVVYTIADDVLVVTVVRVGTGARSTGGDPRRQGLRRQPVYRRP